MNNDDILEALEITGKLMELHNENPFKVRAYTNAAFRLSKLRYDFSNKTKEEIAAVDGVGKSIADKIIELRDTGSTADFKAMIDRTPAGVIEMLSVKGLGPKKVRQLWQELELETVGELLYACNENRLITLKGFGAKTQEQIRSSIEFSIANHFKFHYAALEDPVRRLMNDLAVLNPDRRIALVGQMARRLEVIDAIDILADGVLIHSAIEGELQLKPNFHIIEASQFAVASVRLSSSDEHLKAIGFEKLQLHNATDEEQVYKELGMVFIPAELREGLREVEMARTGTLPRLVTEDDLQGTLHNHTTYSDGIHTLKEMADYCKQKGLHYFGVCDHSRTAFYANGLPIERVIEQQREIDQLNAADKDFRILKGIESDILGDGSLDYPDEILASFDFVVASVHSNLKMSEEKANARVIRAIENPYTTILGHPTGRLLLGRPGYPIDHKKVIDACAANGVSIELNAHPYRLDIDWRWIPYCMEKGVMISINPDAHHTSGIDDMHWGVIAARKGMLTPSFCLNALPLDELLKKFRARRH